MHVLNCVKLDLGHSRAGVSERERFWMIQVTFCNSIWEGASITLARPFTGVGDTNYISELTF